MTLIGNSESKTKTATDQSLSQLVPPFTAPFMMGMEWVDTLQQWQTEWWRAWTGLIGQMLPADLQPENLAIPVVAMMESAAAEADAVDGEPTDGEPSTISDPSLHA